jgi:hypothetical protein
MKTVCPITIRNVGVLLKRVGPVLSSLFFTASLTPAAVRYVDLNSPSKGKISERALRQIQAFQARETVPLGFRSAAVIC